MKNSKENVVRAVETCFDNWLDRYENIVPEKDLDHVKQLKADALEMLKEQEPISPICKGADEAYYCGKCGERITKTIRIFDGKKIIKPVNKWNFCKNCGQAVKWE